ncbi:response regulator transcription factor [Rhizobacter fulvus]|jgi:two-component system response regulator DctR
MNPTIFVVDDEPDVRHAVAFALRQLGHTVTTFADGPGALAAVDASLADLRAIFVLDVRMEPLSGPALHDALIARGLRQRTPVLFLSGQGDIPAVVAAMSKGALDFIEKPHIEKLVEKVASAVATEAEWFGASRRAAFQVALWDSLSPQQRRVALRVADGKLNKVIAHELRVSGRMVEEHRRRVYDKLGVDSAAGLATTLTEMRGGGLVLDDA